ncbi:hypothetical protein [Kitasatospora sp. NPDC002040]|uniref:hypothetical protein n=1 Tax=Kitasatospora sp. NPDC002040 TaxID=3154661 RepID=UPI00331A4167
MTAPRSFVHPHRGTVQCPAAPLLTAHLPGHDRRATAPLAGHAPRGLPVQPSGNQGILAATTYLDLDGTAVGIAIAAPTHLEDLARKTLEQWTGALRTRRVLVPSSETCPAGRATEGGGSRTCPKAAAAQGAVRHFLNRQDTVLLLGSGPVHLTGHTGPVIAIPDPAAAHRLRIPDPERLSFVLQPCTIVDEITPILRVLRSRFPLLRGQHPDQWCYTASDARQGADAAAQASDLLLNLSTPPAPAERFSDMAVRNVRTLSDIRAADLACAATIAIVHSPPADPSAAERPWVSAAGLVEILSGLGPLSVVRHRARTTVSTDIYERVAPADGPIGRQNPT